MSAQLIFSDLDGTLINDDLKVTAATRDAIRRQIINGNIFVPASILQKHPDVTVIVDEAAAQELDDKYKN